MLTRLWRVLNPFDRTAGFVVPHIIVAALLAAGLILSGIFVGHQFAGGLHPAPLPANKHISLHTKFKGGLPSYVSLERYVWRTHDQGSSNSCTGQTVSEMREIQLDELTGQRVAMDPWAVYGQCNGGVDQGASYDCIFPTAVRFGWFRTWRWVSAGDYQSMQTALATGHVVAWASAWYSSMANAWGASDVSSNSGAFQFNHSVSLIGYQWREGSLYFLLLNSWGSAWGTQGRAWVPAWIISNGIAGVITDYQTTFRRTAPPVVHHPKPVSDTRSFDWRLWWKYANRHHLSASMKRKMSPWQVTRGHKELTWLAAIWFRRRNHAHGGGRGAGPAISPQQWFRPMQGRPVGYLTQRFATSRLYVWPAYSTKTHWAYRWIRVTPIH